MKVARTVCAFVILASILACVALAISHSNGLVSVTVTALDTESEPADPNVPILKRKDALPDYELTVIEAGGRKHYLGVKPNESAVSGLTWELADPVSVKRIATVRLREHDTLVSDAIAEVHVTGPVVESAGYRFEFESARSMGLGVKEFFATPIGIAIAAAFGLAVLIPLLAGFA